MKRTLDEILADINELTDMMREAAMTGTVDKMQMAESLAWIVYETRRKYQLTSMFYCIAEDKAAERYRKDETDGM